MSSLPPSVCYPLFTYRIDLSIIYSYIYSVPSAPPWVSITHLCMYLSLFFYKFSETAFSLNIIIACGYLGRQIDEKEKLNSIQATWRKLDFRTRHVGNLENLPLSSVFLTSTLSMPPTSINDLAIELQTSILKHLLFLSRIPRPLTFAEKLDLNVESGADTSLSLPPVEFEWTEKDVRSSSLFPFNVASASKLWCDILALIPECWTRVLFDVAKDPTPSLDVFLWSDNLENIEVFVFNSDDTRVVDKMRESIYVSTIAKALYPHIRRCKSIIFDVTCSKSRTA